MRYKTKRYSVVLLCFWTLSVFSSEETKDVLLLHTNDIESVYEPLKATWRDDIEYMGGIPYLSSLIKQQRQLSDISFLFDAGDIYTGALSERSAGKLPFDLYSAMGYDVVNLGNHEFEYGWQSLVETKPRAAFPVLSANIFHKDSGTLIADPYTILEKDGVRIGVIGVMGEDAFHNATATFQREALIIKPPTPIVQYWVDKIKDDVHMVVVLTHQNKTAPMQTNKESDPSVQRGFEEDYAMAGELRDVDVIFGGHSDNGLLDPVVHPKTGTVIGLTFGQGMHLGYSKFSVNIARGEATFIEGGLIPVDAGRLPQDKKTLSLIQQQRAAYPSLTEEFTVLKAGALRKYNEESVLGNILTDIMRSASNSDIAMINSGAIRADLNAGAITREHILNVYPFIDNLTTVQLTGKQVKDLVEYSCTLPYGIGQFSGIELTFDSSRPAMSRIVSLTVGGKELKEDQLYLVSTTGFVASGGDGYAVFTEGTVKRSDKELANVFFNGFKQEKVLTLPPLGRQKDIAKNSH